MRNAIMSETNKTEYRDTAYIERANGRWEAWTYSEGLKYRLALPLDCRQDRRAAVSHLNKRKWDVVLVK